MSGAQAPKLAQLGTQARPGARRPDRIVAGTRPYRGRGPGRIAASLPHAQRPSASSPRVPAARPAPYRGRSAECVGAVPRTPTPCRGRVCAQAWPYRGLPRDTVPSLKLPSLSQYIVLYCNAIPAIQDCCNIIYCIAIQSTLCPLKATLSRYT